MKLANQSLDPQYLQSTTTVSNQVIISSHFSHALVLMTYHYEKDLQLGNVWIFFMGTLRLFTFAESCYTLSLSSP